MGFSRVIAALHGWMRHGGNLVLDGVLRVTGMEPDQKEVDMATDREIALEQALVAVLGAAQDLDLDLVRISQKTKSLIIDNSKYRQAEHPHIGNAWSEVEAAVAKVRKA